MAGASSNKLSQSAVKFLIKFPIIQLENYVLTEF